MSPYCTYCGTELEESWKVCPNCGKKLKETEMPQHQFQPSYQPINQVVRNPYQQSQLRPYPKAHTTRAGYNYGVASLICGILALTLGIVFIGPFLGIPAIILGGLGISRDENAALGVIGLILGIFSFIAIFFFWWVFWLPWFWFPW